jgi:hypothetical protein
MTISDCVGAATAAQFTHTIEATVDRVESVLDDDKTVEIVVVMEQPLPRAA